MICIFDVVANTPLEMGSAPAESDMLRLWIEGQDVIFLTIFSGPGRSIEVVGSNIPSIAFNADNV